MARPGPSFRLGSAATLLVALLLPGVAHADETTSQRADRLFREAVELFEHKSYAAACPKLEESERLEPAIGTEFDLADCYERTSRLASALALFTEVEGKARASGKTERERLAHGRAAALTPRVAQLRLTITEAAAGLVLAIDGKEVGQAALGRTVPLDAGSHSLKATAPGRAPWTMTLIVADGERPEVNVPSLPPERHGTGPAGAAEGQAAGPLPGTAAPPPPEPAASRWSTQKSVAALLAGVGVVGVIVGAAAGFVALSKNHDAQSECPKDTFNFACPTQAGTDDWNAALTAGRASTVGFVVGGVGLAAGAALWLTAPPGQPRSTPAARLEPLPLVGPGLGGAAVRGTF